MGDEAAPIPLGLPWWLVVAAVLAWLALVAGAVALARYRWRLRAERRARRRRRSPPPPGRAIERR